MSVAEESKSRMMGMAALITAVTGMLAALLGIPGLKESIGRLFSSTPVASAPADASSAANAANAAAPVAAGAAAGAGAASAPAAVVYVRVPGSTKPVATKVIVGSNGKPQRVALNGTALPTGATLPNGQAVAAERITIEQGNSIHSSSTPGTSGGAAAAAEPQQHGADTDSAGHDGSAAEPAQNDPVHDEPASAEGGGE